jgi:signal transduction histidine kinase
MGGPPDQQGPPGDQPPPPREPIPPADDKFGFLRRPQHFDKQGNLQGLQQAQAFDSKLLAVGLAGQEGIEDTTYNGVQVRVAVVPVRRDGQVVGAVETARETTEFQALMQGQIMSLLILLPLALIVGGAGALFLTNKALKPISEATRTASTISEQDLSQRLLVQGADELAELSTTFNGMLGRLQASFEKQKADYAALESAYENQRRFTADASHELRTPLTRLKLATSGALAEAGIPAGVIESLKIADQSAEQMSKIVQQLLLLSKADAGQLGLQMEPLDLRVVAAEAVDSLHSSRAVTVDLAAEPVMVNGDEDHLRRVVLNLVQNALRYTPLEQAITVSVRLDGEIAVLTVKDEGEGVSAQHLAHLGERFYRVDAARSREEGGIGLGLSICKTIVEGHGGTMSIVSELGKGTLVEAVLPNTQIRLSERSK